MALYPPAASIEPSTTVIAVDTYILVKGDLESFARILKSTLGI